MDLLWAKVIPSMGVERYSWQQYTISASACSACYTLAFIIVRGWMFLRRSFALFREIPDSLQTLKVVSYASFCLFSLYHALLFVGIVMSWKFGGRLPQKKPATKKRK